MVTMICGCKKEISFDTKGLVNLSHCGATVVSFKESVIKECVGCGRIESVEKGAKISPKCPCRSYVYKLEIIEEKQLAEASPETAEIKKEETSVEVKEVTEDKPAENITQTDTSLVDKDKEDKKEASEKILGRTGNIRKGRRAKK